MLKEYFKLEVQINIKNSQSNSKNAFIISHFQSFLEREERKEEMLTFEDNPSLNCMPSDIVHLNVQVP